MLAAAAELGALLRHSVCSQSPVEDRRQLRPEGLARTLGNLELPCPVGSRFQGKMESAFGIVRSEGGYLAVSRAFQEVEQVGPRETLGSPFPGGEDADSECVLRPGRCPLKRSMVKAL